MAFQDYSGNPAANTTIGDDKFIGPNMPRDNVRPALQQLAADGRGLYDEMQELLNLSTGPQGPAGTAAANSGIAQTLPATANADSFSVSTALLAGLSTGTYMRWGDSFHGAANQNPGQTPVDNVVKTMGWNVSVGGTRHDPTKAAYSFRYERSFHQEGVMAFEFHEQLDTAASSTFRIRSQFISHDGTIRKESHTLTRDSWYGSDGATEKVVFNFVTDTIDLRNGMDIRGGDNNVALVSQVNAAGNAYVSLPYLNAKDFITTDAPTFQSTAAKGNTDYQSFSGQKFAGIRAISGLATGDRVDHLSANDVTGNLEREFFQASVSGVLSTTLENTHPSGTAVFNLIGANAATGYRVNGTKVVGARSAAIADATDAATAISQLNLVLAALRAHGLIAT